MSTDAIIGTGGHSDRLHNFQLGDEIFEAWNGQIRFRFCRTLAGKAKQAAGTIDPGALNPHAIRRRDISAKALSNMQDAFTPDTSRGELRNSDSKVRPIGFVSAGTLGRHDDVKSEIQLAARALQGSIIDIAQRTDFGLALNSGKHRVTVGISRPRMRCRSKLFPILPVDKAFFST